MSGENRLIPARLSSHKYVLNYRNPKEPLIYSSMSRVAGQIGKIAMRAAQVVAGTLTPSRTRKRAPDLTATRMGRGLAGELLRCVSCQGE